MNKANLYDHSCKVTIVDSQKMLKKYSEFFNWNSEDSVLDAGCGPGGVTHDVLLPFLPENFKRLIGVDISKEMIEYARKRYIHPKLSFQEINLNIGLEKQCLYENEKFEHIFSFYALQWIPNQKVCLQNFNKLLQPGGDMFLVFLGQHPLYDVYREQSDDPRWASYMTDAHLQQSPYHYSIKPEEEFRRLLSDCGFKDCNVVATEKQFNHTEESLTSLMHSVNPFIDRIPSKNKQNYLNDLIERLVSKCKEDENNIRPILLPYTLIIAYARK